MDMLNEWLARRAEYWRAYSAIAADPAAGTIIPLRSKRVTQTGFTFGVIRELPAVFTVVVAAASALRGGHDRVGRVIAGAELIAGAGVLVAIGLEARHLFRRQTEHADAAPHKTPRVDMTQLAAAALGYVEAWHRTHVVGHFKLVSPEIVGATLSLVIAFIKSRPLSERRRRRPRRQLHVCITRTGISYLAGPRLKWRAEWTEVAAVEHDHGELGVRLHDGRRHVIRANDHLEAGGLLAQTRAAIATHAPQVPGAVSGVSGATSPGPGSSARVAAPHAAV